MAAIRIETVEGNADTTDDEEETSESDVANDKDTEDSRKKQLERGHRLERFKYRASWDEERQRIGTKYERRTRPKGERSETDETSDSDTSIEQENNEGDRRSSDTRRRSTYTSSKFTIKDVEGSLTHFTGDDKLSITKWIAEFEDISNLLQWNKVQKLIHGKRMLQESAKCFISFVRDVTSRRILKRRLKKEFKVELNSALIHNQLYKRRRQPGESSRQYIYAMQEITDEGYIEEDALIQYIVDGLPDEDSNKTSLYEACTIGELKKNLEVYDRLKERTQKKRMSTKKDSPKEGAKDAKKEFKASSKPDKKRCFNYRSPEYDVRNCTNADKGSKCFKCNCLGHVASRCDAKTNPFPRTTPTAVSCVKERIRCRSL